MSRENQSNMEKESNYYEENVCLPFKMEVELQNHIESFISIMRNKLNVDENINFWVYPVTKHEKVYLQAITTRKNPKDYSIIDLQEALNKGYFTIHECQDVQ